MQAKIIDHYITMGHSLVQGVIDKVMDGSLEVHKVADQFPFSSHAADFQNKLMDYLKTGSGHPSMSGGYVIEDYATANVQNMLTQHVPLNLHGSRPDFMIPLNNPRPGRVQFYGLVDATSSQSVGHILKKGDGTWLKRKEYPYVAETLYDPLAFGKPARKFSAQELEAMKKRELDKKEQFEAMFGEQRQTLSRDFNKFASSLDTNLEFKTLSSLTNLSTGRATSLLEQIGLKFNLAKNKIDKANSEGFKWYSPTATLKHSKDFNQLHNAFDSVIKKVKVEFKRKEPESE